MAYVDLNPIRAGIAATPEESEFTSIQARIQTLAMTLEKTSAEAPGAAANDERSVPLLAFRDAGRAAVPAIPFSLPDYLELVDWTGRAARTDKRGAIDARLPPIMHRLNIDAAAWRDAMRPNGNVFGRALGQLDHLRLHARALGQSWIRGVRQAGRLYGAGSP